MLSSPAKNWELTIPKGSLVAINYKYLRSYNEEMKTRRKRQTWLMWNQRPSKYDLFLLLNWDYSYMYIHQKGCIRQIFKLLAKEEAFNISLEVFKTLFVPDEFLIVHSKGTQ